MEIYRSIVTLKVGRLRWTGWFSLVLTALICCGSSMTALLPVQDAWAVETTENTAATARQLQLEGSRLQLQGDLTGAIKKYQESIALQANPRLESLVQQLEKQAGASGAAAPGAPAIADQAPATTAPKGQSEAAPPAGPAGAQSASAVAVPPVKEASKPLEPPLEVKHIPGTPEEELIYAFTDWALALFPHAAANQDFNLKTNRNYALAQTGGSYEVRLDPFIVSFGENDGIDLSPIVLSFKPQGKDKLAVTLHLPKKAPLFSAGKTTAELTIGSQEISGIWDLTQSGFDRADLKLGNLAILDSGNKGRFEIKEIVFSSNCSRDEQGLWDEKLQGTFSGLSFVDDKTHFDMGKIAVLFHLGGSNFAKYAEVKKRFQRTVNQRDVPKLPEMKTFLGTLDEYIQLLNVSTSSMAIQGIKGTSDGGTFHLNSLEISGGIRKDSQSGRYIYDSKMEAKEGGYTGKEEPAKPQPVTASLASVGIAGKGTMKLIPPNMFTSLLASIEGFENVTKEESDAYLAKHGTAFARKILELIEGYSTEINLHGLNVLHAGPNPVTIDTAQFGGGFDVGSGQGGKIQTHMTFSGLNGPGQDTSTIPKSASFNFEIKNIPSLLHLLSDPNNPAAGTIDQIQGQAVMKAMNTLMMSALTFSLTDSFVAFPASRVSLSLLANIDNKAKYLSTGNLSVAIENPGEFMRIAQSFGADPEMQKMLVTITALANRSDASGKIVDTIDARINQEGKVFINAKDVTLMFFPEPAPVQQAPPKKKTK